MIEDEDPGFAAGVQKKRERSAQMLDTVARTAEELARQLPEIVGVTVFGSVARGEARADSDVDAMVFVEVRGDARTQSNPRLAGEPAVLPEGEGPLDSKTSFHPIVELDYKWPINRALVRNGIDKSDIDVCPISDEIIDTQVAKVLAGAEKINNNEPNSVTVPRNLRGLFHAPVMTEGLVGYQHRVMVMLAQSPHGETAWNMIRDMVVGYEQGRKGDFGGAHREIPGTLEEARIAFTSPQPEG
jgi:hypothetical protein